MLTFGSITVCVSRRIRNRPTIGVIAILAAAILYFLHLGVRPHLPPLPEAVRRSIEAVRFFGRVIEADRRVEDEVFPTVAAGHFMGFPFVVALAIVVADFIRGVAVWAFEVVHNSKRLTRRSRQRRESF